MAYTIREAPIHTGRKLRVICIGAGASGLLLAYKIKHNFYETDVEVQIYEKNSTVGGTWAENIYPGCACDIPAHTYTYSFEPKADWRQTFATSDEIYEYFASFATKYDLLRHIQYDTAVSSATWDETACKWLVEAVSSKDGAVVKDSCDILINACGILNAWRWPAIPGLDRFAGPKLHSAAWDPKVDLKGKKIALVGNGSSGIQLLPALVPVVSSVVHVVRGPAYVAPVPLEGFIAREFRDDEIETFTQNPDKHLEYRKRIETAMNTSLPLFHKNSEMQQFATSGARQNMQNILKPELRKTLIPDFPLGCRRITPGPGYLEAMNDDKCDVVVGNVAEVTSSGLKIDDGREYAVDALVFATGFDTSFKPRFPVVGPHGSLAQRWADEPRSYLGLAVANFPNYFHFLGPNSPVGSGPTLAVIEVQIEYAMKLINKMRTEDLKTFAPKPAAVEEYIAHKNQWFHRTVWLENCRNWYKTSSGNVTGLWAGSGVHYAETIARPRWEDFDWTFAEPSGNRWSFLGNGFSQRETTEGADLAWYLRNKDESVPLGKKERFAVVSP